MKKLFKLILIAFVALIMAAPAYAVTNLTGACGQVLSTAGETYVMTQDIDCSNASDWPGCEGSGNHVYGLIVAADNVTIEGNGYHIIGGNADDKCCKVVLDEIDECDGHPCRHSLADAAGNQALDSGILNALPATGSSGFNGLTVKDVEISGFCDGIFVSGSCGGAKGSVPGDYISKLHIEDNFIHNNGQNCDPTKPQPPFDEGGVPQLQNYNDGIFVTVVGVPAPSAGNKTSTWCDDTNSEDVVIKNNSVWAQKGCGIESCAGGNGINVQGGIEDEDVATTWYGGCIKVCGNKVQEAAMSGIMLTHALQFVKVCSNALTHNGFGGVTIPCDFSDKNIITKNAIFDNWGPGIGLNCAQKVDANLIKGAKKTFWNVPGWIGSGTDGTGIFAVEGKPFTTDDPGEGYVITNNVSCSNADQDIDTVGAGAVQTLEYNQCASSAPAGQCDFGCASNLPKTWADFNGDGQTNPTDNGLYLNSVNADNLEKQSPWMFD